MFPPEFIKGIQEFNDQKFFECHETLESLWNTQTGLARLLTQGIIQIAVGYYHATKGNLPGAGKLFTAGLNKVRKAESQYQNIDMRSFTQQVEGDLLKVTNHHEINQYPMIRFVQE